MRGAVHMQISTIGLDIAKNVFQVHGIDAAEKVVVRKQLRRGQVLKFFASLRPCLVGMEACATAHYWARELTKLGHEVRLMPAKDVKAYVKRNKNDAADAEAICEAVRRPTMRFVRIKSAEQQGQLMQHRTRDVLIRQRTQIINALRAHLAELGLVAAQGNAGVNELRAIVTDEQDTRLPIDARASVIVLAAQLEALESVIGAIEKRIKMQHRARRASGLRRFRASGLSGRLRSWRRWRTRLSSGRDAISRPGSDRCRGRIRPGASRSSDRFPSREIATCGAFSSSGQSLCCGAPRRIPGSIPGSRNSWRGDPSRSWRWRSPTRWRAWPGRCWPMVAPIGRLSLLKLPKGARRGREEEM